MLGYCFSKIPQAFVVSMCIVELVVVSDALADAGNCAQFNADQGSYIYVASTLS